jgi:hypothetical protein
MVNHAAEAQEADEAFEARRRVRHAHAQELARLMRPLQIEATAEIAPQKSRNSADWCGDG